MAIVLNAHVSRRLSAKCRRGGSPVLHPLALSPRTAQKVGAPPQRPEPGRRRGRSAGRSVVTVPVAHSGRPAQRGHLPAERRGVPVKRSWYR